MRDGQKTRRKPCPLCLSNYLISIPWESFWMDQFSGLQKTPDWQKTTTNTTSTLQKKQKVQILPYTPRYPVQRANLQHCGNYPEGQFVLKLTHRMHSEKLPLASHHSSISPERIGFTLCIQSYENIYIYHKVIPL